MEEIPPKWLPYHLQGMIWVTIPKMMSSLPLEYIYAGKGPDFRHLGRPAC